jgi:hypothetical protein
MKRPCVVAGVENAGIEEDRHLSLVLTESQLFQSFLRVLGSPGVAAVEGSGSRGSDLGSSREVTAECLPQQLRHRSLSLHLPQALAEFPAQALNKL